MSERSCGPSTSCGVRARAGDAPRRTDDDSLVETTDIAGRWDISAARTCNRSCAPCVFCSAQEYVRRPHHADFCRSGHANVARALAYRAFIAIRMTRGSRHGVDVQLGETYAEVKGPPPLHIRLGRRRKSGPARWCTCRTRQLISGGVVNEPSSPTTRVLRRSVAGSRTPRSSALPPRYSQLSQPQVLGEYFDRSIPVRPGRIAIRAAASVVQEMVDRRFPARGIRGAADAGGCDRWIGPRQPPRPANLD
jgi:hypothetical protein